MSRRKLALGLMSLAVVMLGFGFLSTTPASAQSFGLSFQIGGHGSHGYHGSSHGYHGSSHGYRGYQSYPTYRSYRAPVYHAPSVHYDRVYHVDGYRVSPRYGVRTRGHYDVVPHYTPGHVDTYHNGHIDTNPRYHH